AGGAGKRKADAAFVFDADRSGHDERLEGGRGPEYSRLLSVSAEKEQRAAKCSLHVFATGSSPAGRVSDRHTISVWFFAEGAPGGIADRGAGLSVSGAHTGVLRSAARS